MPENLLASRLHFSISILKIKKKLILCSSCLFIFLNCQHVFAQNVGIANTSPTEKLSVNGNLLVTTAYTQSVNPPDASHTSTIAAGDSDSTLIIADSAYRLLDPGGAGNYVPNIPLSVVVVLDSTGATTNNVNGTLQVTFESIDLGTGDSLIVVNALNNTILLRGGNNLNGTTPLIYTGNGLAIYFSSNADANVGAGFSALVKRLYPAPATTPTNGVQNYGNAALFYNVSNASFIAGFGNSTNNSFGSVALGSYNTVYGNFSAAIGQGSRAIGVADVAIAGGGAFGGSSVAIGVGASTNLPNSAALGYQARAYGQAASALAALSTANGAFSAALGYQSTADGNNSVAITGGRTDAGGNYATAIGTGAYAAGNYSMALGKNATTGAISAIAVGEGSRANGDNSLALGTNAHADGNNSIVIGAGTAGSNSSITIGTGSSSGFVSTAIGQGANANGTGAVAIGHNSSTGANYATCIGDNVYASGLSSFAAGYNVSATGNYSTAMGCNVSTSGFDGAFTIGDNSTATIMGTFVANGFRARFANGYRLFTNSAATIGSFLNAGANSWAALSDRRLKENLLPVNGEAFLKSINDMELTTWNYIGQDPKIFRHYGPMAQDFYAAFGKDGIGVIGCDTLINQQDFLGVSFIAIQSLIKRTETLASENTQLKTQILQLQKENEERNKAIAKKLEEFEMMLGKK